MQMEATWRTKFIQYQMKIWAISDSERVSVKSLVGSGSKFWFQTTREKSEIGPLQTILAAKRYVSFFWVTLYICM